MGRKGSGLGLDLQRKSSNNGGGGGEEAQFHVLAVDDSIVDRRVIERLLKISAFKVTTVESGRRALEFLGLDEEHNSLNIDDLKVNMIITDYCMPGMTGYDLLKKIKESSTCKEMPVVVMSSENVLARIDRCLQEGAKEFILKPVKLSDVRRLKGHIVKGHSKELQHNPISAKRKAKSDKHENLLEQPSERCKIGKQSVA